MGENGLKAVDVILVESEESCKVQAKKVSDKIREMSGSHKKWAAKFIFCELANFAVAISQFYFTNSFLSGEFLEYGTSMLQWELSAESDRVGCHPMSRVSTDSECPFVLYTTLHMHILMQSILLLEFFCFRSSP